MLDDSSLESGIAASSPSPNDAFPASVPPDLLERIRDENLNVYRASPQRLREDFGQESQIAQDYRGRLVYELLQNADDAMANGSSLACIRFELTDTDLWVANSGRALDEADVRGLCGISASKKSVQSLKRRASIGHKGMGFKSVLEISDAPEVFSTTVSFRFSSDDAARAVQPLVREEIFDRAPRAPVTRFPWAAEAPNAMWDGLRLRGMNTGFRFPLRSKMTGEQRERLAAVLRELPITSLIFLKHIGRVEVHINRSSEDRSFAWSVLREHSAESAWTKVAGFDEPGEYRVTLEPDDGEPETFLVTHDADILIGDHRGGLDEFTWDGVEFTEVSVAARLNGAAPVALKESWRRFHVFLPTGEPCPYDLLVNGAFGSNLSRQGIRVENDSTNYNRFLFQQAARLVRDRLLPELLAKGSEVGDCLRLLDRRLPLGSACATVAADVFYREVRLALADLPWLPAEDGVALAISDCAVPPLVGNDDAGRIFRALLPSRTFCRNRTFPIAGLCGSRLSRILVDHGAYEITPEEAASTLTLADPERSKLDVHSNNKVFVDPVLSVLEMIWFGLEAQGRLRLATAARREALFPVSIQADGTAKRISTKDTTCFYPPRSLRREIPLPGLSFLLQDLCWGDLTPTARNIDLALNMTAWEALFDLREFKFPEVMRASVLPALDLDRESEQRLRRHLLHDVNRLAAICQLAGRTPNPSAPLPYERLKANRALLNLSRLDVPCRGTAPGEIKWVPAYRAYFGSDWLDHGSVEAILEAGRTLGLSDLPVVDFILGPEKFSGLLGQHRDLEESDASAPRGADPGEDEVGLDEDEDAALTADDRERWSSFFRWLGVNASLRPVHFHDVEDRASGWLSTNGLTRPDGWAFRNIPASLWNRFREGVFAELADKRSEGTVPYFYELHDLEHLVALLRVASSDPTASFARALYEHLAHHWGSLEGFSRAEVALISTLNEPAKRTKPQRAKEDELTDGGHNLWWFRLLEAPFCPTGHGPRRADQTWLPTPEVQRRFGRRGRTSSALLPSLEVDRYYLKGKPRAFAQALGVRDELSPATFSVEDARLLLERLTALYDERTDHDDGRRSDLREFIRPAYRELIELFSGKAEEAGVDSPLADSRVLATDGRGTYRFLAAREVFYLDRRDTRERLATDVPIWTFVIEAWPSARAVLPRVFGMRILEEALTWAAKPGDPAFDRERLEVFRTGLWRLAPYVLARVGADRSDERAVRRDALSLRSFVEAVEPVASLDLHCLFGGTEIGVCQSDRDAFVSLEDPDRPQAFVVWGENPWPPDQRESEALACALCDVLGPGYFESFLALLRSEAPALRERILRRAGAPSDVDERRALLLSTHDADVLPSEPPPDDGFGGDALKTAPGLAGSQEVPALPSAGGVGGGPGRDERRRVPLYAPSALLLDGVPVLITSGLDVSPRSQGKVAAKNPAHGESAFGRYGGDTDLDELDALGMSVALAFERERLRRSGVEDAQVFPCADGPGGGRPLVFNVSAPDFVETARATSPLFDAAITYLHRSFGIVPDWPGFDILTLDPRQADALDRMIELKSSGVASRVQEMTWNEWKTAKTSRLRERFFLYLVGNLRADLPAAGPFIRTIRNPFEQIVAEVQDKPSSQRLVQLAVHEFREAEHLNLTVRTS